jgi:hypothetical protein
LGAGLVAFLVVGVVYAATVNVDTFNAGAHDLLADENTNSDSSSVNAGSTDVLGTYRDAEVNWVSGTGCDVTLKIDAGLSGGTNELRFSNESGCQGTAQVVWDGDNDAGTLSYNLSSADLLDTGNTGIYMVVLNADKTANLELTGYEDGSNYEDLTLIINSDDQNVSRLDLFFPFDSFSETGNGAVWSSLEALTLDITGDQNLDLTIDYMESMEGFREYGDLPSSYGTLLDAYHVPNGLTLGINLDAEGDDNASNFANGDDESDFDDEDGVTMYGDLDDPSFLIDVNGCNGTCYVNGWIDWTGDDSFDDTAGGNNASEHILNDEPVSDGSNFFDTDDFSVPDNLSEAVYFARFRICDNSGDCNDPGTTAVSNGEIEDYQLVYNPTAITLTDITARSSTLYAALGAVALVAVGLMGAVVILRRRRA